MGWIAEVAGLNQEIRHQMGQAFADLERSLASLLLESDAREVVAIFEDVRRAFVQLSGILSRGPKAVREAGDEPYARLRDALSQLETRVPELEAAARRHLSSLEQAI